MQLANRGGVPKLAGDRGQSTVNGKMGNGNRFKLSNVLPNVFSKIKGIRRSHAQKFSIWRSECASTDMDHKDYSIMSRDSQPGDRSPPSSMRSCPQNVHEETRYSSSPVLSQNSIDIRLPTESPIRSKGSYTSGSLTPPPRNKGAAEIVDSSCCSFDSSMALVPHDGRVCRMAPQAFGRCLIMSKCNSFSGSTHSDSEISETDSSRVHSRQSRTMSAQLEGTSCEGYGLINPADERTAHRSGKVSVRHKARERSDLHDARILEERHQPYGGSSPIQPVHSAYVSSHAVANCCRADQKRDRKCLGSTPPNLSSDGSQFDRDQTNGGRPSRKLSFATDENARPFDDNSYSSDDEFPKVVTSNANVPGHYRSRSTSCNNYSQQQMYGGNQELAYTTEDERKHAAAIVRREALLARTVLNATGGWAQVQVSRFSKEDKPTRRASFDAAEHRGHKKNSESPTYGREASLVKAVLNARGWANENLRALVKANELDRQHLARLKGSSIDLLGSREDETDRIEYEAFGLPLNSRDYFRQKSSRHPSPISGEVEKYTEGRVDYKSSAKLSSKSERIAVHEEFGQPVAEYASSPYKSGRSDKSEKEFGKPWDTEFPSFRSDSILMSAGIGPDRTGHDERPTLIDREPPTAHTPKYLERQMSGKGRGVQQQEFRNSGKVFSRSPSPLEEAMSPSMKIVKPANQTAGSPRLSQTKRSPATPEFSGGKKPPSRTPSPILESSGRKSTSRSSSPAQEFQKVKKTSRTPSPARAQSPLAASANPLIAKVEAGIQRLDSVAVVKASYDPYHDFRESMVEMILENDIRTAEDLEGLLQCYLSLNSSHYHKTIVQVFSDVWGDIFEQ